MGLDMGRGHMYGLNVGNNIIREIERFRFGFRLFRYIDAWTDVCKYPWHFAGPQDRNFGTGHSEDLLGV